VGTPPIDLGFIIARATRSADWSARVADEPPAKNSNREVWDAEADDDGWSCRAVDPPRRVCGPPDTNVTGFAERASVILGGKQQ
jgi:hypothetical protein